MKMGYFIAGFIFLMNPNIGVFDILPDFIGYLFIIFAMSHLSDVIPALASARQGFLNMLNVSLGRAAAMIFMLFVDASWSLVLVFSFFALELWFSFKAFLPFFDGIAEADLRYGRPLEKDLRSECATMTYIFIVVKNALCLLPSLTYLSEGATTGTVTAYQLMTPANYRLIFTLLNLFVVGILGFVWLFMMRVYLKRIFTPRLIEQIDCAYQEKVVKRGGFLVRRNMLLVCKVLMIGCVFMLSLFLNNINILPNAVFAGAGFAALYLIKKHNLCDEQPAAGGRGAGLPFARAVLFFCISILQYALTIVFYAVFHFGDSDMGFTSTLYSVMARSQAAKGMYFAIIAVTFLEMLSFLWYYTGLVKIIKRLALLHTPVLYSEQEVQLSDKNVLLYKQNCRRIHQSWAGAAVFAGVGALHQLLFYQLPWVWGMTFICSIIYVCLTVRALNALAEDVENKYMLE